MKDSSGCRLRDSQRRGAARSAAKPGRLSRRRFVEIGSAAPFGLSLPGWLAAADTPSAAPVSSSFGRARSCVVIFLWGGPGQQDLWDLKPDAPSELRSEFSPIATNVPGIEIGEGLQHLARQADKFALVRSMTHKDFEHGTAAYTALTGQPHPNPGTNTPASPDDFPTYGSVVARLRPTREPVPDFMVLGPVMHQGNRPPLAGQNAGFLGASFEPFRIADDPNEPDFRVDGVTLPSELAESRFLRRRQLLAALENHALSAARNEYRRMQELYGRAFDLLTSPRTQHAFQLQQEADALRDRYGRTRFGQSLLLARRLVEARVPLITINWSKQNADQWDTHKNNYPTLRTLLPPFDRGLAAFLEDLHARGLLESTLVVCLGEFGRTPKMNPDGGRDHWPDCYSILLAGGGVQGGRIHGRSDRQASYPVADHVAPWDIAATLFHLLGVDPAGHIRNRQGQPLPLTRGRVVSALL